MKHIFSKMMAVALLSLIPCISQAETRHLVDTPDGQKSCVWKNGGYSDCMNPGDVRYEVDTPDGKMACLWQNGSYVDCKSVASQAEAPATAANSNAQPQAGQAQPASSPTAELAAENAAALEAVKSIAAQIPAADATAAPAAAQATQAVAAPTVPKRVKALPNSRRISVNAAAQAAQAPVTQTNVSAAPGSASAASKSVRAVSRNRISVNKSQNTSNAAQSDSNDDEGDPARSTGYSVQPSAQYESRDDSYPENDYADDDPVDNRDYNSGVDSGMTLGFGLGWYGHIYDGDAWDNGVSLNIDVGWKWKYVGFSLDLDVSISPEDDDAFLATYSVTPMIKGYIPLGEVFLSTIGFGVGYSGWNREREYRHSYHDWWDDDDSDYDSIGSGGNLSLKLQFRVDFVVEHFMLGIGIDWIPYIDTNNHEGIVDNLVGIVFRLGGII